MCKELLGGELRLQTVNLLHGSQTATLQEYFL